MDEIDWRHDGERKTQILRSTIRTFDAIDHSGIGGVDMLFILDGSISRGGEIDQP